MFSIGQRVQHKNDAEYAKYGLAPFYGVGIVLGYNETSGLYKVEFNGMIRAFDASQLGEA